MKQILIIIISLFILTPFLQANLTFATNEDNSFDIKEGTFNVGEWLKLDGQPQTYFNEEKNNAPIVEFIIRILEFATKIIGSIAILLLIITGFMFMFSQGNQQGLDKAKEMIKYVIIGLLITFLSYIITIFVQSLFF